MIALEVCGAFVIGIIVASEIISVVYYLFGEYIDICWKRIKNGCIKIKYIIFGAPVEPEPTICDKLGDDNIIWEERFRDIQQIRQQFKQEETRVRALIEFIFPAPQITCNKFSNDVTRLRRAFDKQYNSIHIYVRAYPSEDFVSEQVIESARKNLLNFLAALEEIAKELSGLIVCDRSTEDLMSDMKRESESIKQYREKNYDR